MNGIPKIFIIGAYGKAVYMSVPDFHKMGESVIESSEAVCEIGCSGVVRAVTAKRLGYMAELLCLTGDEDVDNIETFLSRKGIVAHIVQFPGQMCSVKTVVVDKYNDVKATIFKGGPGQISRREVLAFEEDIRSCSALLLDCELQSDAMYMAVEIAKRGDAKIILTHDGTYSLDKEILDKLWLLMIEERDVRKMLRIRGGAEPSDIAFGLMRLGIKKAVVLLDSREVMSFENDEVSLIRISPSQTAVKAGILDILSAAIAVRACEENKLSECIKYGCAAIAVNSGKSGVLEAIPYKNEVRQKL